ncbi:MAG: hypothetical protein KGZ62_01160 [Sulfurimonas sp.]|nr:hypothetical protein [Sulfurimonas sp.]
MSAFDDHVWLIQRHLELREYRKARQVFFERIVPLKLGAENLNRAVRLSGVVFNASAHCHVLRLLLNTHGQHINDEIYRPALARIYYALRDRRKFVEIARRILADEDNSKNKAMKWAAERLSAPNYPEFSREKVFCIGLSKTGTSSLSRALEYLGYASVHWRNPITGRIINYEDFLSFDAFSDISISYNFEYLYYAYPKSRFIYTVRPLDKWLKSFEAHYTKYFGASLFETIRFRHRMAVEYDDDDWLYSHYALYLNARDPIDAFVRHDTRVRKFFSDKPADRFVEMNIFHGDSWGTLCSFLGKPVPADEPFPWKNKANQS